MKKKLLYISGILTLLWGINHLFPTAGVVKDFGDISSDNKLIITMEWIVEGLTLIFLGVLTISITIIENESKLAKYVYVLIISMLFSLAILSLLTGFRIDFLPFKLCPIIFSASAILIIVGLKLKPKTRQ
jgi:uncharacterized membrane protein YwaF